MPTDPAPGDAPVAAQPEPVIEPFGVPGKRLVLPMILVVVAAAVIAGLYWSQERTMSEVHASFAVVPDDANATVLDSREVRLADRFLDAHLDLAMESGATNETVRLRVESMLESLRELTGDDGTEFIVVWKGVTVRVVFTGFESAVVADGMATSTTT